MSAGSRVRKPQPMLKTAGLVCEGASDVPIFSQMIVRLWPSVGTILTLMPEVDEIGRTKLGGRAGWSEVKQWCESNAGSLEDVIDPGIGPRIDLLVVAVDLDIAIQAGIEDPPSNLSAYDANRLCRKVKGWLQSTPKAKLPREVVIAIPCMAIETWVIAALFPKLKTPEAIPDPASYLVQRGKLAAGRNGKAIKPPAQYRVFASSVVSRLKQVRARCDEAERFCRKIEIVAQQK